MPNGPGRVLGAVRGLADDAGIRLCGRICTIPWSPRARPGHRRVLVTPSPAAEAWPALRVGLVAGAYATLHLWTQIVGKTRLALAARGQPLVACHAPGEARAG